jgi:replication fork protection complex subunit Tof1/Swi1
VELLVQLTWQIELDPNNQDQTQCTYETPLKFAQIGYKNAILHHPEHNILRPIIRIALPSMAIPRRDRPERDDHIIGLVISLLRNLIEISARNAQAAGMDRDKNEYSRSEMILSFERSDVFNLLAALATGTADEYEKIDCLLLEVFYHLLKGVNVEDVLATVNEVRFVR